MSPNFQNKILKGLRSPQKILPYILGHPLFVRWTSGCFWPLVNRYCPICKRGGRSFKTIGDGRFPDCGCPYCRSYERHRFFWLCYEERLKEAKDSFRFLHFAPEVCFEDLFEKMFGDGYVTADLFRNAKVKADIMDLPWRNDEFDFILCSHILEHVSSDKKAMEELYRVLKPGGEAVIMVPLSGETTIEDPSVTDPEERIRLFGQFDHVRLYGMDIVSRLQGVGFSVTIVDSRDIVRCGPLRKTLGIETLNFMAPAQMFVGKK